MKQNKSKHIFLYADNLYGYAMQRFLTTGGFKWIDIKEFNLNKTKIVQKTVYWKLILNIQENYTNYTMIIL